MTRSCFNWNGLTGCTFSFQSNMIELFFKVFKTVRVEFWITIWARTKAIYRQKQTRQSFGCCWGWCLNSRRHWCNPDIHRTSCFQWWLCDVDTALFQTAQCRGFSKTGLRHELCTDLVPDVTSLIYDVTLLIYEVTLLQQIKERLAKVTRLFMAWLLWYVARHTNLNKTARFSFVLKECSEWVWIEFTGRDAQWSLWKYWWGGHRPTTKNAQSLSTKDLRFEQNTEEKCRLLLGKNIDITNTICFRNF